MLIKVINKNTDVLRIDYFNNGARSETVTTTENKIESFIIPTKDYLVNGNIVDKIDIRDGEIICYTTSQSYNSNFDEFVNYVVNTIIEKHRTYGEDVASVIESNFNEDKDYSGDDICTLDMLSTLFDLNINYQEFKSLIVAVFKELKDMGFGRYLIMYWSESTIEQIVNKR